MTQPHDTDRDDGAQQVCDLALVCAHAREVRSAARALIDEPGSPEAMRSMQLVLGAPAVLAQSALQRLVGPSSGQHLTLIDGGVTGDEDGVR